MNCYVASTAQLCDALKIAGEKTITVKKGNYEILQSIVLTDDTKIVGEEGVHFRGAKRVFFENTGDVVKISLAEHGIDSNVRFGEGPYVDFWKEYDIPKPHLDDLGPSMELYFGSKKMKLTRFPEKGFAGLEKCLGPTPKGNPYSEHPIFQEGIFVPKDKELFEKNDPADLLLVGYWAFDWATQRHTVESYDQKTGVVKVNPPYHVYGYCASWAHYYALNVKSSLKKPGDWYIDKKNGYLYLIPYKNQKYVDIAVCDDLFVGENIQNVCIENINISQCRKSAFKFTHCKAVTVSDCTVQNVGAWGVIADDCDNSLFTKLTISNTGGGGIACSGGDRNSLRPCGNVVSYNDITQIAYWHKTYHAGIELNGVGATACFNKIYDVPHFAIVFQGNNHVIEGNEIKNACLETGDSGAVYAGRDYTCRGNIIRYNYIHDIIGYKGSGANPAHALYFDDGMCSAEVYGNTFANVRASTIVIGGGRDFYIHDNTFCNCKYAVSFDNRMEVWPSQNEKQLKHLYEVPYRSDVWKAAYPELYDLLDNEPKKPKGNRFENNTLISSGQIHLAKYSELDTLELLTRKGNLVMPAKEEKELAVKEYFANKE